MIHLIDPVNMKLIEIDGVKYFQYENEMIFIPAKGNVTEFLVFDVENEKNKNLDQSFVNTRFKPVFVLSNFYVYLSSIGPTWQNIRLGKLHRKDLSR
jgi:hypothetical protein